MGVPERQQTVPGFTEPTLALGRGQAQAPNYSPRAKYRHCLARARRLTPRPEHPPPLRCTNPLRRLRGALRYIPATFSRETVRTARARPDRQDFRGREASPRPRLAIWARCSACRPGQSNSPRCFARARHRNTARGSAYRRGRAIIAGTVQPPNAFGAVRPRWKDQIGLTLRCWTTRMAGLGCPCTQRRSAFRFDPPAESQIHWLALARLRRETSPADPAKMKIGFAASLA